MKRDLVLKLAKGEVTAANAAALSNKFCQMANGKPVLVVIGSSTTWSGLPQC